jgi:acyl-coenzyme A thioesterase PaaI-like protein
MDRFAETAVRDARTQSGTNLRARLHPHCVVCSPDHPGGLCLRFTAAADDTVAADFQLDRAVEGYVGWSHGGITSAVLDGAMTNWLFAHGLIGVTAELDVQFRYPINLEEPAKVTARLKSASHPVYELEACITQNSQVKAHATGMFLHKEYDTERPPGLG